jgi:preprotein translocase subunit SecF
MFSAFKIVEKKNLWFTFSFVCIALGFVMMAVRGFQSQPILNFGVDFSGGSTMLLKFEGFTKTLNEAPNPEVKRAATGTFIRQVRECLGTFGLEDSSIQTTETGEVIIKTVQMDGNKHDQIRKALQQNIGNFDVLELDFIGPTIGAELRQHSIWIILLVAVGLMAYITWRFEFAFGVATLIATLHDALFVLSFASIFNVEVNVEFIAAVLTIVGYSMNDTVVIFDRIRENLPKLSEGLSINAITNTSLYQTLSRTFFTVLTTLIMTTCLLIFGGATIRSFSLVLLVGIVVGTYSSLFIAAPSFVMIYKKKD